MAVAEADEEDGLDEECELKPEPKVEQKPGQKIHKCKKQKVTG